jgi:putative tryptophan/tyrosine transport system substrate-binding protein
VRRHCLPIVIFKRNYRQGRLVATLNAPGGNVTGVSTISTALAAKRLELLHQLASKARSVGILVDPTRDASDTDKTELQGGER